MKIPLAIALLVAISAAPHVAAANVTVQLSLTAGQHLAPSFETCDVVVPSGSTAKQVLDAAVAQGCISSVQYGFGGAFVNCIDGLCGQNVANTFGTFWAFYVNEELPGGCSAGINDVQVSGGESIEFVYADWYTPFVLDC